MLRFRTYYILYIYILVMFYLLYVLSLPPAKNLGLQLLKTSKTERLTGAAATDRKEWRCPLLVVVCDA